MAEKRKRVVKEYATTIVTMETGEIVETVNKKEWIVPREEPDFIKLYISAALEFNNVSCANAPLMTELLKYVTYADDAELGGQMVFLNGMLKDRICKKLHYADCTLRANMKKLCDGKIIRKVGKDTYQLNPFIFGKGDWNSIKNLRASFDWENGFIVKETIHDNRKGETNGETKTNTNF